MFEIARVDIQSCMPSGLVRLYYVNGMNSFIILGASDLFISPTFTCIIR